MQRPAPSHRPAGVTMLLAGSHTGSLHWVLAAHTRHWPVPSHLPSVLQGLAGSLAASAGQLPWTGAVPSGMGEQVPTKLGTLQAWQEPSQALSQHTPST